jgi:hypothetical protein
MDSSDLMRFRQRVSFQDDGCWIWTGSRFENGYGVFALKRKQRGAHRIAYEYFVGPVPDGLELDHTCRVRHCVNPEHLEPVTHAENMARGRWAQATHCIHGHEFTPENTRWRARGNGRDCRTCVRARNRRYRLEAKLRAA